MKIRRLFFSIATLVSLTLFLSPFLGTPLKEAVPEFTYNIISAPSAGSNFDTIKTDLSDYIWPTDASHRITSSFAEYRSTHFHGGIDISTNGRKGYPVYAVRDGFVYRIRISPTGYGKMLYVKHKDGYVSTYAHLQTFNRSEERRVGKECRL